MWAKWKFLASCGVTEDLIPKWHNVQMRAITAHVQPQPQLTEMPCGSCIQLFPFVYGKNPT